MKVNKMICLDLDVAKELEKEKNASALVNSYLRHYYNLEKQNGKEE
jgi:hypothetical protein